MNGDYITAEDVGMSPQIMQTIASRTKYVTGLPTSGGKAGGDPSPKTAYGIFGGIEAAVRFKLGRDELKGTSVAIQGVGNVGYHLCRLLHDAGATLSVAVDYLQLPRRFSRVSVEWILRSGRRPAHRAPGDQRCGTGSHRGTPDSLRTHRTRV